MLTTALILLLTWHPLGNRCTYHDKPLYGRVELVDEFEDVRVKVVNKMATLDVEIVTDFADECGEWMLVTEFPDIRVKIVNTGEDITIRYVNQLPGIK